MPSSWKKRKPGNSLPLQPVAGVAPWSQYALRGVSLAIVQGQWLYLHSVGVGKSQAKLFAVPIEWAIQLAENTTLRCQYISTIPYYLNRCVVLTTLLGSTGTDESRAITTLGHACKGEFVSLHTRSSIYKTQTRALAT